MKALFYFSLAPFAWRSLPRSIAAQTLIVTNARILDGTGRRD